MLGISTCTVYRFFLKSCYIYLFIYLFVSMYACVSRDTYGDQRTTCGSSCFHHVGPGDQTQMVRLGSKCKRGAILLAYNLLSPISHCFDRPNHNWFILQLANSTMLKQLFELFNFNLRQMLVVLFCPWEIFPLWKQYHQFYSWHSISYLQYSQ